MMALPESSTVPVTEASPPTWGTIGGLCEVLNAYMEPSQVEQVRQAHRYAEAAHQGQQRQSGEPFITHPLAVAHILADMRMDCESLMAAILHDVLEDCDTDKQSMQEKFGVSVAELVDGVSKLDQMESSSRVEAQAKNFYKMALATARDIRVILVKLADRLHNMRTIGVLPAEKRQRIARETLEIYAPISMRLGMNNLRMELEDLSFRTLYPMRARRIAAAVEKSRQQRRELVVQAQRQIEENLKQEGIKAKVYGREKHLYSVYSKILDQHKSFREIMDVFGFRVITEDVDTCYRVLGIVHNLYKPVPGQFEDYIAIPKENGYQSLHTVLIGLHGVRVEVQIRTYAMDEMADHGIAAHWHYKLGEQQALPDGRQQHVRRWLQNLLDLQKQSSNSGEFIENVRTDLFPNEIYVFTPDGDIMKLPKGATALDFAYAVHTDIGDTCIGCYIDKRAVPLSEILESGQTVEILSASESSPNPSWLDFAVTPKARGAIRHHLKKRQHQEAVTLGRQLLERSLRARNTSLQAVGKERIQTLLQKTGFEELDQLLADIGLGNRAAVLATRHLVGDDEDDNTWWSLSRRFGIGIRARHEPLPIYGTEGMVVDFGKCCGPIPGDPIVGHLSTGRGLVVHTIDCQNVKARSEEGEEYVPLSWAEQVEGEFTARLQVDVRQVRGIVAELANLVNRANGNIEKLSQNEKDGRISSIFLAIGVRDRVHLARIIRKIRRLKATSRVTRIQV